MPPPMHVKATWSGTLGTDSGEVFSVGLAFTPGSLADPGDTVRLNTLETAVAAVRQSWSVYVAARVSSFADVTRTRLSLIGADGKTVRTAAGAYVHKDDLTAVPGTGSHFGMPYQVAMAVSTTTARDHRTGRGRFYLPLPAYACEGATGLISEADRDALATAMDGFLTDLNTVAGAGWGGFCAVASGGSAVDGYDPAVLPILSVRVGRVMDTIRSRRAQLIEDYSTDRPIV